MGKQPLYDQDDLSNVEHRLSGWRPQAEGLNADAMLFAAGLTAAERRTSRLWPALCAVLIVQIACLGAWGISERYERLALSSQLADNGSSPVATAKVNRDDTSQRSYSPSPNDYLHQRKRMERDAGYFVAAASLSRAPDFAQELPQAAIFRAGQWSDLLD